MEFNAKWSVSNIAKRVNVLDARTYALYQNEANENSIYYEGGTQKNPYSGKWEYPYVGNGYVYSKGTYNPSPDDFLNPGIRQDEYGNIDEVAGADW